MITQIINIHGGYNWTFSITKPRADVQPSYCWQHLTGVHKNLWTPIESLNLIKEIEYNE